MMPLSNAFGTGALVSTDKIFARKFFHDRERFWELALQHQEPPSRASHHSIRIALDWNRSNLFFGSGEITSRCNYQICFQPDWRERLRRCGDRSIKRFLGGLEIAQGHVTQSQINQDGCIFRIERGRFA
jgi:hypothetical protein